ncbi:DUF6082 family protein [Streptomyces sp. NPDC005878]|uniref:DUF6082 family protein n=2 Tax=unclassified Streptomyces TaxID=2593676 RepID=UPI00340359B5
MTSQHRNGQHGGTATTGALAAGAVALAAALSLALGAGFHALAPAAGAASAGGVFAGLAIAAGAAGLALQNRLLARRLTLTHQHRLHFDLLSKAIDDPELAAVLDTFEEEVPPVKQRQFLYANALYSNVLHAYRTGSTSESEIGGHLHVICRSPIFREYWEFTRRHRAVLQEGSQEARLGRRVDEIVQNISQLR